MDNTKIARLQRLKKTCEEKLKEEIRLEGELDSLNKRIEKFDATDIDELRIKLKEKLKEKEELEDELEEVYNKAMESVE